MLFTHTASAVSLAQLQSNCLVVLELWGCRDSDWRE